MNPQAFKTLEFNSLRELLQGWAQTKMGWARIDALEPIDELKQLQRVLRATADCIELRRRGGRLSFDGIADPADSISRLRIEGTALDDRASPELARIRRELASARSRITRALESLMRRSSEAIQEELVTVRNDRFVIPVRADHQARIKGVAHGSSSSGATIFVEPLETIDGNNELQTLREAEQREIAEILFALSEELRRELLAIELAAAAVAELDFISAKAAFAERFDCVVPKIGTEPGADRGPRAGSPRGVVDATGSQTQVERHDPLATARGSDTNATLDFIDARHPLL